MGHLYKRSNPMCNLRCNLYMVLSIDLKGHSQQAYLRSEMVVLTVTVNN